MRKINYIVIHHTAVNQPDMKKLLSSINASHKKKWLHKSPNSLWYYIAYHYIIWVNWELKQTRADADIWYHASNLAINNSSLWIVLSGDFDRNKPSDRQILAASQLVSHLRTKYWQHIKITYHNMYAKKTCPWLKFPYALFDKLTAMVSKFKQVFDEEVKDPIFTVHGDKEPCTIWDAKYLMEIGIARSMKKLYDFIKVEDQKDRNMIQRIFSYLKLK